MKCRIFLILALIVLTEAIKVPVDNKDISVNEDDKSKTDKPVYYESETDIDTYLIPPSPHKLGDEGPQTLPSYLVPPAEHSKNEYYEISEDKQSSWLPIAPPSTVQYSQKLKKKLNLEPNTEITKIRVPSRELELPIKEAGVYNLQQKPPGVNIKHKFRLPEANINSVEPNIAGRNTEPELMYAELEYNEPMTTKVNIPSTELQTPIPKHVTFMEPREPTRTLALRLMPPPLVLQPIELNIPRKAYPHPTRLFPKKHIEFKTSPEYVSDYKALSVNTPRDEKKFFQYQTSEQKRQLNKNDASNKEKQEEQDDSEVDLAEPYSKQTGLEQEASETNFEHPEQRKHPVSFLPRVKAHYEPLKPSTSEDSAPKERTEFRMHGMKGPHSYQFGYDTGKGKNRQFRFEERDNEGRVHGHYGYMDRSGKLRVFNYNADPDTGFHSEAQEPSR